MLFSENLIRVLLMFNGLRSRYCQRALLVYHYRKPSMRSSVDAMSCTTTCLSAEQLSSGIVHHALSDPTSSHCETGLVSSGLFGLLASWLLFSLLCSSGGRTDALYITRLG